jgi:hypothetical protein
MCKLHIYVTSAPQRCQPRWAATWRSSENTSEAKVNLPRRATIKPAIDQQEAKDYGFLEEAPARPGG